MITLICTRLCSIQGAGVNEFIVDMRKYFTKVVRMRVDASRSMSREFYAVGLGRKKANKE
jgi:23S rRNA (uridine2552-2'-O)-methyltransferase